jgi:hypothetical protein
MKKLWNILSGNKTILCLLIFGFIQNFGADMGMSAKVIEMILWVAGTLGLFSGISHAGKGSFRPDKK